MGDTTRIFPRTASLLGGGGVGGQAIFPHLTFKSKKAGLEMVLQVSVLAMKSDSLMWWCSPPSEMGSGD